MMLLPPPACHMFLYLSRNKELHFGMLITDKSDTTGLCLLYLAAALHIAEEQWTKDTKYYSTN